ncbi:MAG: hypothetical protein DCC75_01605 [Proteobacteria bacterium]|nr:MAG: hypothetical protein DCC75_01605 [Pseudomonadota bacterium]
MTLDPIEVTKQLVAISSVNPFKTIEREGKTIGLGNEGEINIFLEGLLRSLGFSVRRQPVDDSGERYNLLAEKGSGTESVLLFGHTDTVDVKQGWESDPFSAAEKVVDGRKRLYGLGVNDMKSGLAAILAALARVKESALKVKVAFLVDEEFWSFGAVKLVESDFLDDVVLAIAPEIGGADYSPEVQWIGVGMVGRCEYEFNLKGRACHGADAWTDSNAVSAVHEAVKLEGIIIDYCKRVSRKIELAGIPVYNSSFLSHHQGGLPMLSVPDAASFVLDRSFLPGEDTQREIETLNSLVKQAKDQGLIDERLEVRIAERARPTPFCRPHFFEPSTPAIARTLKILQKSGVEYQLGIGRSVADENRIASRGIPTLTMGPWGAGSHTPQEWVDVESVVRLAETLEAVTRSLS